MQAIREEQEKSEADASDVLKKPAANTNKRKRGKTPASEGTDKEKPPTKVPAVKKRPAKAGTAAVKSKAKSKAKSKPKGKPVKTPAPKPVMKKPAAKPKVCPRRALTEGWRTFEATSEKDAQEEGQEAGEEEEPTHDPECEVEETRDRCKVAKLRGMQLKGTLPKAAEELLSACKGRGARTKVINGLFVRDKRGHLVFKMPDPKLGISKAALSSETFNDAKKGLGPILFKAKFNLNDVQLQEAGHWDPIMCLQ